MLIIMLCHRRRRKNLPTEIVKKPDITDIGKMNCGDQCKGSDRSSNISDLKMELRQVEGSCEMVSIFLADFLVICDPKVSRIDIFLRY